MLVYLVIFLFLLLMVLRVPIAFSMIIPSTVYILIMGLHITLIATRMTHAVYSFVLLTIPLFMLAGNLMNSSGATEHIFSFARKIVGFWPGGLANVNVLASLVFAGTSGSALADIGGLGVMEIKAMEEAGYERDFSCAVTISSATIGPIFPPSIPLIIFAAVNELSGLNLLLAGVIPGLLTAGLLMVTIVVIALRKKFPKDAKSSLKDILSDLIKAFPALLSPLILIGGMMAGIFSPTEAAAVTVIYTLFLGIFVYRKLDIRSIVDAMKRTIYHTSTIMFLIASALLFSNIIAIEQIPKMMTNYLLGLTDNPYILLLIVNGMLLFIGCFMDNIAAILLFSPIVVPMLVNVGIDPIHIGIIFVYNLMIGLITPPVCMSVYLVSSISGEPAEKILKSAIPLIIPLIIVLFMITYVPRLSLFILDIL